jgi:hypothetical protein
VSDATIIEARNELFCPFVDSRWQKSFLQMPRKLRYKEKFYKHLCSSEFPKIFPDLTGYHELVSPKGSTNIDWGYLWNSNDRFMQDIKKMIERLSEYGGWFSFEDIEARIGSGDRFSIRLLLRLR